MEYTAVKSPLRPLDPLDLAGTLGGQFHPSIDARLDRIVEGAESFIDRPAAMHLTAAAIRTGGRRFMSSIDSCIEF